MFGMFDEETKGMSLKRKKKQMNHMYERYENSFYIDVDVDNMMDSEFRRFIPRSDCDDSDNTQRN
eukprot:CAMPEP_0170563812 /NCGR_PEP_ID=MMETSP0211-20121228/69034_1 /TAXON_ID=311385 /ORGANISM="Pseudokeronopsis sp., Strain OXSARD2" /LENGTH=64 /DNA_ID=CAMNT_0010882491 /DNA_START=146 /DNA_END=340 /DNA_ORIENTATION=+